jgi:uncharacterized protein YcfJ
MQSQYKLIPIAAALLLGGCVSVPTGPQVMVMPGRDKTYEQFRQDEAFCQQSAFRATDKAARRSTDDAVNSAAVGTAVGAVAGALIGAAGGRPAEGAAIGAGGGLLIGSAAGSNSAVGSGYSVQRRFDDVYTQCMYTRGNRVPVAGGSGIERSERYGSQPSAARMPPPPPGYVAPPGGLPPAAYGVPPDYVPPANSRPPPPGAY